MVRLVGISRPKHKKRLSPSAKTPESLREKHPMYQYAMNEFAQTVAAGTSNDTGNSTDSWSAFDDGPIDSNIQQVPSETGAATSIAAHESQKHGAADSALPAIYCTRSPFEAELPDTTYEESYGEAYTGGNIKYIYPSGYQSMRPRSCPWKLSIVVCLLFTWLSVFIVGHCSDQVDQSQYRNEEIDDDSLVIDIRWCGSRPLYLMWVMSMLITGLAAAYCSVIGYIKVRDFVVGNSRSQPPGVMSGKSDYYVRIEDGIKSVHSTDSYYPSIYQSDGTPQFWGAHIYRPTQAAVAITSR